MYPAYHPRRLAPGTLAGCGRCRAPTCPPSPWWTQSQTLDGATQHASRAGSRALTPSRGPHQSSIRGSLAPSAEALTTRGRFIDDASGVTAHVRHRPSERQVDDVHAFTLE